MPENDIPALRLYKADQQAVKAEKECVGTRDQYSLKIHGEGL